MSELSFRISEVSDHELGHGIGFCSRGENPAANVTYIRYVAPDKVRFFDFRTLKQRSKPRGRFSLRISDKHPF
jgi:hypothetical protein